MDLRTITCLLLPLLLLHISQADPVTNEGRVPIDNATLGVTDIIFMMNAGSPDFLLNGDVLIPRTRTAMKCYHQSFSCLWEKSANGDVEVPFIISEKYDSTESEEILNAMKDFHSKTCIRFIPRVRQRMYISFEPRYGCFSSLGRLGDKQVVSLQRYGCVQHGIIQHELLHALGFYHEHTRSDRDQYVTIHWDKIKKYYISNFRKMDTNNLNTPYDYDSVMHYGRTAFAKVYRETTITPVPDSSVEIGQRHGMSKIDIERINNLYKCEA